MTNILENSWLKKYVGLYTAIFLIILVLQIALKINFSYNLMFVILPTIVATLATNFIIYKIQKHYLTMEQMAFLTLWFFLYGLLFCALLGVLGSAILLLLFMISEENIVEKLGNWIPISSLIVIFGLNMLTWWLFKLMVSYQLTPSNSHKRENATLILNEKMYDDLAFSRTNVLQRYDNPTLAKKRWYSGGLMVIVAVTVVVFGLWIWG